MAMHIRRFYLKGDGKVFDVYLRPSLIALGVGYDLRIACRNLRKENRIEVIVSGVDENIQQFWEYVKEHDVRPVGNKKPYTVSEIEPYEGIEPDWTYHMSASTMEQITKGVTSLEQISKGVAGLEGVGTSLEGVNKTLREIDGKFGRLEKNFGTFSLYARGMDEKLDSMSGKLDTLPERIAEALSERKPRRPRQKSK